MINMENKNTNDEKVNIRERKIKRSKQLMILSLTALMISVTVLGVVVYGWFVNRRQLSTATWIETPIVLRIGSGNDHDIKYLDMGDIDVETATSKDYVFCIYGSPVDNYSLQLAYTTNIAFHYEIYRAVDSDDVSYGINTSEPVASVYVDAEGNTQTEYFKRSNGSDPVITGYTLKEIKENGDTAAAHQSHHMSYGDENGKNEISRDKVQDFNEPLYWLAEEAGTSVLMPKNIVVDEEGVPAFLDYYIIHIEWDSAEVKNDKETDIVYLTASH